LDTGADLDHTAFGPDANSDGVGDRIVYDWDYVNNDSNASDDNGHGTNVAGIAAGLASGANLIILKVLDNTGNGSFNGIQSALQ
jgi:subtilisin family serine protease